VVDMCGFKKSIEHELMKYDTKDVSQVYVCEDDVVPA
jgi:hypothetical protein